MISRLLIILFLSGCVRKTTSDNPPQRDSILNSDLKPTVKYDLLISQFLSSDSVVLFSHFSPNMPIKNPKTGKYYPKPIPFVENGKINYATSVKERKQLNEKNIRELTNILCIPAVDDSVRSLCFEPRNAVVIFRQGRMSCFDFCFECNAFSRYGKFDSELIMNAEKYKNLLAFFKKLGFKYEVE